MNSLYDIIFLVIIMLGISFEIENKYELDVESVTKKIIEFVGKENER